MARVEDHAIEVTTAVLAARPLPTPSGGTDKFQRGQVLVVGGSSETPGGVLLAATAALRVGAGRVRIATVRSVAAPLAVAAPELRVTALAETAAGELSAHGITALADSIARVDVVLLGSGMAGHDAGREVLAALVPHVPSSATLVVDAAPLAAVGREPELLGDVPFECVLLPNCGEMAELLEREAERIERDPLDAVRTAARRFRSTVALRGSETFVAAPGREIYVDRSGHPALATSGSGDVLAGAVAGLVARGASPVDATLWAVHAHACAGRELASRHGLGILAHELPELLARALATTSSS